LVRRQSLCWWSLCSFFCETCTSVGVVTSNHALQLTADRRVTALKSYERVLDVSNDRFRQR
jgi:hypothetical protein